MRVELRLVTKTFRGRHLSKKNRFRVEQFNEGDQLIVYENDGTRVSFVRVEDARKKVPFVAYASEFETSTELEASRYGIASRSEFEFGSRRRQRPRDQNVAAMFDGIRNSITL